jgi:hypothetical protein
MRQFSYILQNLRGFRWLFFALRRKTSALKFGGGFLQEQKPSKSFKKIEDSAK